MCYGMRPDHLYVLSFFFFFPSFPWVYCRILFFIVVAIYRYRFCYHAAIAAAAMFVICLCSTAFQNRIAVDRGSRLYQAVMAVIALRYTHIYIYMGCSSSSSRNAIPPQLKINCYQLVLLELPDRLSDIKPTAA